MKVIEISVSGEVSNGKSSILQTINDALVAEGLNVVVADKAKRLNPSRSLANAKRFEKPPRDSIVLLIEECT